MPQSGFGYANSNTPGTYIVHDPDIAMGHNYDQITGAHIWFAVVVYETNGEIYMEAWEFDPYTMSGYTSLIPVTFSYPLPSGPTIYNGGQQYIGGNGNAKYPHVDLIVDHDDNTDPQEISTRYVVTWEENGVVMNADGDLFSAPLSPVTISDGTRPAIAGVSNYEYSRSVPDFDDDMVYTTYIDGATNDLMLAERKFGDPTVLNYHTLATAGTYSYHYPRIEGARYYDYSASNNTEPVCVVVASEEDAFGIHTVKSYTLYEPDLNPGNIHQISVSDYGSNGRFTSNNCIMPTVTGTGVYTRDKYAGNATTPAPGPQPDFSVVFYSDYTWDNNAYDPLGNGDLYNSNIDMSTYEPVNTSYQEVFGNDSYSPWALPSNRPLFDAASSNNSNYDIYVAYYDGEHIYSKYTGGNSYTFKPTNINSIANAEIAVYPNPVTTAVTIGDGDGSDYTVTDITGKVMATGVIDGNQYTIPTENYAAGTYILQLVKDGVPSTVKFVKQ